MNKCYVLKVTNKEDIYKDVESPYFVFGTDNEMFLAQRRVCKEGLLPEMKSKDYTVMAKLNTKEELKKYLKDNKLKMSEYSCENFLGLNSQIYRPLKLKYRKGYFLITANDFEDSYYYLFDDEAKYDVAYFFIDDIHTRVNDEIASEIVGKMQEELDSAKYGAVASFFSAKELSKYIREHNIDIIEENEAIIA